MPAGASIYSARARLPGFFSYNNVPASGIDYINNKADIGYMRKRLKLFLILVALAIGAAHITAALGGYIQTVVNVANIEAERIVSVEYIREGVSAAYPKFTSERGSEGLELLNDLILKDFNRILQIYAFEPFIVPAPTPGAQQPVILKINYQIKLNNPEYVSILYLAAFSSPFAAHPTNLVYTTNIDRREGKRLVLGDLIRLDMDFVSFFKSWKLADEKKYPDFIKQGIEEYISGISNEQLLSAFMAADIIASGNLMGIYSYLTEKSLGISISLPNYLGDHAEFEMDYNSLAPYLKQDLFPPS